MNDTQFILEAGFCQVKSCFAYNPDILLPDGNRFPFQRIEPCATELSL